jgi:Spy/CpxP family protein refolding chaperone
MKKLFASAVLAAMFAVPATFAQNASTDAQAPATQSAAQSDQSASATPTQAQRQKFEARMIQRRVAKMTALLTLTPAQQTQVTSILTNAAQSRAGDRGSMKQVRAQMRTAIEANDSATIEQASNQIGNMAAQNAAARAKTAAAIYQILTPDQKAKAQQLADLFGPEGRAKRHHQAGA